MPEPVAPSGDPTVDSALREAASTSLLRRPADFSGTERFELLEQLGEGGFGIVYKAIDHVGGGLCALKLLRRPYAERLYRFKREFRALSALRHNHLIQLHELHAASPDMFFTMELIDGVPFLDHIGSRPDDARRAIRQLAEGLCALHQAGKLHCDVKPSNILVDKTGRVVLLDFGLAVEIDTRESTELVGTPRYMSPEQCAQQPLTQASDWYAVGVVLYEALTGQVPFDGPVGQLLKAKQTEAAPRPRTLAPAVPPDLDELCALLLSVDPRRRPSGDEVLQRLSADAAPTGELVPAWPGPGSGRSDPFVGRSAELAVLSRLFDDASAGACKIVLALGPSGIGKSALLRHFLDEVRRFHPAALILAGRCYELESVPYKALDEVIDDLARQLRRLPEAEAAALLPREARELVMLFPVLRQVPVFARASGRIIDHAGGRGQLRDGGHEPGDVRGRALAALRELFARLTDRRPVVVCVDDLQWGDADSAVLLGELVREPRPPGVLWVASVRQEEAATSPMMRRLTQLRETTHKDTDVTELRLGGLGRDEAQQLASMLVRDDAGRAEAIAAESGGSPFFVHELARASSEDHALGSLVRRRVARLEGAARRMLEVVAVAAQPLDLEVVAEAADLGDELREALDTLRVERLIRNRETDTEKLVESYHDRIREAVVDGIAADALRAIHLRLAAALEEQDAVDPAQIGHHLAAGGEPARASGYLASAAKQAAAALAFEEAALLYQRALQLFPMTPTTPNAPLEIELAYADVLSAAGRGPEAARLWLQLVDRVDEDQRIDLMRRSAEELLISGHVQEGYAAMDGVLAKLGLSMPHSTVGAVTRVMWSRLRKALGLAPRFNERAEPASPKELLRVDTIASLAWTTCLLNPLLGYALQTKHLPLALRSGDRLRAALSLAIEATGSAQQGSRAHRRTTALLTAAHELTETQVPSANFSLAEGIVALLEGRWTESLQHLDEAERRAGVAGHGSVRGTAHAIRIMCLFWMGRSGTVLRIVPSQIRAMEEHSNLYAWVWLTLLEAWAHSCNGRIDEARALSKLVRARLPAEGFTLQRWYLEFGQVKYLLLEGKAEEAWQLVQTVGDSAKTGIVPVNQAQRVSGMWVRANAALARAHASPTTRKPMLAEARRVVRWMDHENAPWIDAIARTIRASAASVDGDSASAVRLLAEAEPLCETHHLEALLAACRQSRGRRVGGDTGRELISRAAEWTQKEGTSPALLQILVPGTWDTT